MSFDKTLHQYYYRLSISFANNNIKYNYSRDNQNCCCRAIHHKIILIHAVDKVAT